MNAQSMPVEAAFGRRVKELRTAGDLSQREVAARMVDHGHPVWVQSTVGRTETGARPLRLQEFVDLCVILSVEPTEALRALRDPSPVFGLVWLEAENAARLRTARRQLHEAELDVQLRREQLARLEAPVIHEGEGEAE